MGRPVPTDMTHDPGGELPKPGDIPLDAAGEERVLASRIQLAARGLVGGSILHMALAVILVPLLASEGRIDAFALMNWAGALIFAAVMRFLGALWYIGRVPADPKHGKVVLVATGLLVGVAWGALPVLFFSGAGHMEDVLIAFVLGGVALGALTVSGYYLPSFYALFLTSFTPLVVVHFLVGDRIQTGMATMLVLFWIAVVIFGRRFSDSLVSLLRLRVLRDSLIRQLREARDEAEAANRAKTEFLATISHEIRTPMHGVLGAIELLLDGPLGGPEAKFARIARDAGHSLRHLLDDLLDVSRIEAGRLDLDEIDFSPADTVRGSADIFRAAIARKGLALDIAIAPDVPERVCGDPARLRQILVNLIDNAVKFTTRGGIGIALAPCPTGDADGKVGLRFSVRDSGIGIAPDFRDRMFTKFSRGGGPATDRPGGTGLGLAIVRGLVRRMGGELDYESTPGAGSLFRFDIPFMPASGADLPAGPESVADGAALAGLRLLLVDDSPANRILSGEVLRRAGARVEEADSGAAAVERARAGQFDLLLMDISMPGMDGVEALARIRAEAPDGPPAIALTAQAAGHDGTLFRERGFAAALIKPVARRELIDTVRRNAAGTPSVPPASPDVGTDAIPAHLRERFLAEARDRVRDIRAALEADDPVAAGEQAHALKGTASTFGACALAGAAARLEDICAGKGASEALPALAEADRALAALAGGGHAPDKVT